MAVDPRTPCLVGVGQRTWRPDDPDRVDGLAPEPLLMWEQVARLAAADTAAAGGAERVLGRVDDLRVVYTQTWAYDDPGVRLATALDLDDGAATTSTGIGGTRPLQEVTDLARRIAGGELGAGLVVTAEALDTVRRIRKAGEKPAFSHREPERRPFPLEAPFLPGELAHEVFQAWLTFATFDVGRRAARGEDPEDYRIGLGELFAPLTRVAAANPHAWFPVERSAAELTTVTPANRMVGYPYTKYLVSVMDVDMAAAVLVTSHGLADELGIPAERRVYLRGAAYAEDPHHLAEHPSFAASAGLAAASQAALGAAGVGVDDIAHLDLYSCFPSSVGFAVDALGLAAGDPRGLTVTGGLPYFGGPGSGYGVHQLATMVPVLRDDPGSLGLCSGVGMHMTKHAYAVLASAPPATPATPFADPTGPARATAAAGRRTVLDVATGPATVASYSVVHDRDGAPAWALVVADLPAGERCYAKALDPDLLVSLEAEEWVGRAVTLTDGGNGVNLVVV